MAKITKGKTEIPRDRKEDGGLISRREIVANPGPYLLRFMVKAVKGLRSIRGRSDWSD